MLWLQLAVFLLTLSGLFSFLGVQFNDFLHAVTFSRRSSLKDDLDVLLGKPARNFFNRESMEIEQLLAATGREGRFALIKRASVALFALGAVIAFLLNNPFLIPILGAGFAFTPVWYLRSTAAAYKKHLNEELETAISVITTSYLRSGDLLKDAREAYAVIKKRDPAIHSIWEVFLYPTFQVMRVTGFSICLPEQS